jgi:hypothetical protein
MIPTRKIVIRLSLFDTRARYGGVGDLSWRNFSGENLWEEFSCGMTTVEPPRGNLGMIWGQREGYSIEQGTYSNLGK